MSDQIFYTVVKLGTVLLQDKLGLLGVEHHMIRMMCVLRLVNRVSSNSLREKVEVVVKIEDILRHSCLQWHGHVIRRYTNSQIHEAMELEIVGERKKGCQRKFWEKFVQSDLARFELKGEDAKD